MSRQSMSVEIRRVTEGICECGVCHPIGHRYTCHHHWECDWGRLDNMEADPKRGVQHLIAITGRGVERILDSGGAEPGKRGGTVLVTVDGDRTFLHLEHQSGSWTWELFPAHFQDGRGPNDLFIGRWPD